MVSSNWLCWRLHRNGGGENKFWKWNSLAECGKRNEWEWKRKKYFHYIKFAWFEIQRACCPIKRTQSKDSQPNWRMMKKTLREKRKEFLIQYETMLLRQMLYGQSSRYLSKCSENISLCFWRQSLNYSKWNTELWCSCSTVVFHVCARLCEMLAPERVYH